MTLVALFSTRFITCGSFWSIWIVTRCGLVSAAMALTANAIERTAAVARRPIIFEILKVCPFVIASEAKQSILQHGSMDCFVAALLAMTVPTVMAAPMYSR